MEHKINSEIDRLVDLKSEISEAIDDVEDVDERLLLRYRYLGGHTWEEIGCALGVSNRTIHRLHSSALQHFSAPT